MVTHVRAVDPRWIAALQELQAPVAHQRAEALDGIQQLLAELGGLPAGGGSQLGEALRERLFDSSWSVIEKSLLLIRTLVSDVHEEVDALVFSLLLNAMLAKVSDSKVVVRKAASQALAQYMSTSNRKGEVMGRLIKEGVDSPDWKQRQATPLFPSLT